ncbi:extracellular catalytic domain type 1 short-chain-length polyhydroxyalkanoate depolymerase [Roseateles oligotrophus]|uniref:Prolyl oligopeptidase family serine peptidase n=1 Tax=Roseateles oligotrophus TaxID=1769250 RepID=A0ABT2YL25_9BURK|nr:PHB depolymerase family esterase [Roseateles oligotrophus]MCV2370746.1 prolyl oligopeptidase family serine peptidase [Roseateles oligotrophus]
MKRVLRFLLRGLLGLIALLAVLAGVFAYFLYTPDPEVPQLSGSLVKGEIDVAGVKRGYRTYVPKDLPKGAPLVLVMHGSGEGPGRIRVGTGYAFERLADQHGFALVYPKSFASDWNDCSRIGDKELNGVRGDDVGYLAALVDKLVADLSLDPARVFATGVSNGGSMALRLALEQPNRYKAVAAVVANVPAPQNFQCKPAAAKATSVMIMNGTEDPLVPYAGGEINLLGLFYKGGEIISSRASAQYFADWAHLAGPPQTSEKTVAEGVRVEQNRWRNEEGKAEVELVSIHGGGHGLPQPYSKRPRLLGPSPMEPNGPAMIWAFFERQPK